MQINQLIKDVMKNHKQKIELIQWAIMNGVASLIYSEYIRRIQQKNILILLLREQILLPRHVKSVRLLYKT